MIMLIANALLPVYVGLALGYGAGRRGIVDNVNIASLNSLLMNVALPLSLFLSIAQTPRAAVLGQAPLAAVLMLMMVLVFLPMLWLSRRVFSMEGGAIPLHAPTIAFPNIAGVGLPVLASVFGPKAALPVAMGVAAGAISISPLTLALMDMAVKRDSADAAPAFATFIKAISRSVRRPIFLGPALGVIASLLGASPPALLATSLHPVIACSAGLGLFLTGLMLSAQPIRVNGKVIASVFIACIAQPLLAFGLATVLGLSPTERAQVLILASLPCGFFGLVFGANFNLRSETAGSSLVMSSLVSAVILAGVLALARSSGAT